MRIGQRTIMAAAALLVAVASPASAQNRNAGPQAGEGNESHREMPMMGPGLMGPGAEYGCPGYGGMGYGMMGPGRGYGGQGFGMMGPGQGYGGQGFGMMGPGQGYGGQGYGMMGPGMSGPGMMGPGMAGPGMSGPGMMGPGMMGMMGPGMMGGGPDAGGMGGGGMGPMMGQALPHDLTVDEARHMLSHQLAWQGNPNLELGDVEEANADTITAEIVTKDGSLVRRLEINRHTGMMRPAG